MKKSKSLGELFEGMGKHIRKAFEAAGGQDVPPMETPGFRGLSGLTFEPRPVEVQEENGTGQEWGVRRAVVYGATPKPKAMTAEAAPGTSKPTGGASKGRGGRYEVTQREAAARLGVSERTVKNWEAGASNPWGYTREKRRNKAAFAAFVAGLHRDLSTGENMMEGAGKIHLGNRRGMGMKKGPK